MPALVGLDEPGEPQQWQGPKDVGNWHPAEHGQLVLVHRGSGREPIEDPTAERIELIEHVPHSSVRRRRIEHGRAAGG